MANLLHHENNTLERSNSIHLGHMDLYCAKKNNIKTQTNRGLARQHSNTSSLLNNTDPLNMQQAGWLMWYRHRDSGVTVKATRLRWNSDGKLDRKQHTAALSHCVILCGNSAGGSAHTVYLDTHTGRKGAHGRLLLLSGDKRKGFYETWQMHIFYLVQCSVPNREQQSPGGIARCQA